jgi:hypothetical protein
LRHTGGWIKLHRKILDSELFCGKHAHALLALWSWLMLTANYKQSKILFGGKQITLQPGENWIGLDSVATQLSMSKSAVHRHLQFFEKTGRIKTKTGKNGTIVTICNWESYQGDDDDEREDGRENLGSSREDNGKITGSSWEHSEEGKKGRKQEERSLSSGEAVASGASLRSGVAEERNGQEGEEIVLASGTVGGIPDRTPHCNGGDTMNKPWNEWTVEERLNKDHVRKEKKPKSNFAKAQLDRSKEHKKKSNRVDDEVDELHGFFKTLATRAGLRSSSIGPMERNSARNLLKNFKVDEIKSFIESAMENWEEYRKLSPAKRPFSDTPDFDNLMAPWGMKKWDVNKNQVMQNESTKEPPKSRYLPGIVPRARSTK